ncbi:MAG: ComF family protein [Bacteroidales bacterium]|nr:ComF family protein [Bacteroidales bacterium]MDY6348601.1 ComF family protein [Bacteroidales bacterium]
MKLTKNLLSFFYPRMCVACGDALQQNETSICIECMLHLPETGCHKERDNPLRSVFDGRARVEEVAALMSYSKDNKVQKILHGLKYGGQKEVGEVLGEYYGKQLAAEERFSQAGCIVPVPLHRRKLRKRGYNQSEWIARGLSKAMHIPYVTGVLVREDYTETQTKKSRYARWMNVKEVFAVKNGEKIAGLHVILCDDVLTTGATAEAAIHKLEEIPGVKVSVVTLAAVVY